MHSSSKAWFARAARGERLYNLPEDLAVRARPPRAHGINLEGLGAAQMADALQSELYLDLNARVHDGIVRAQDALPEVGRYSTSDFKNLSLEMAQLFELEAHIERAITKLRLPVQPAEAEEIRNDIDTLAPQVEDFVRRVNIAARRGVESVTLRNSILAVFIGAIAVSSGWYVYSHRKRTRSRRS